MNKKGISSIELLVSFVIISFVAIGMFKAVFDMLDKIDFYQEETQITILKGNIINSLQKDLNQRKLYSFINCGTNCYDITYQDLTTRRFKVDTAKKTIQYGGIADVLPKGFDFTGSIIFNITTISAPVNRNDSILRIFIPMSDASTGINGDINIVHQFDSRNMKNIPNQNNANGPVLAAGMVPIKWNGSSWIDTTKEDMTWYSYDASNKMWANARTSDGSMWVWIPRYIYKISSGWHTNTTGTIDIQFSKGTDDNWNSVAIGNIDTGTTAESSNNKWTNHPAFTFGSAELTGIWVAKFEASNDGSSNVKVVPNVASWRNITVNDIFNKVRSMETNNIYGWGATGNNIDTHMMKNTEWGVVAYLSKSTYGKNSEIWINNSNTYITGCAANSASEAQFAGCENTYNTTNGQQASTTGNIYGIYDMSGGAWEYTSAYINNNNINLTTYGNSAYTADNKYKNIYEVAPTDSESNNYALTISSKGDAIYETSAAGTGTTTWYSDFSYLARVESPWIDRGSACLYGSSTGMFAFHHDIGSNHNHEGFRPTLLVGAGL
jgi:hypothetical protein